MNRNKLLHAAVVAIALAAFLGSCAKPPQAEIDAAKEAVAKAESDADAPVYAAATLESAKEALSRTLKEAEAKRYDQAKALALETVQIAEKAIADGKTGKERAKASAASTIAAVKTALADAEKALAAARKTRGVKLDFAAVAAELAAAGKTLASAEADFNNGAFKYALEKSESAQSAVRGITGRIADAVRAVSKKK